MRDQFTSNIKPLHPCPRKLRIINLKHTVYTGNYKTKNSIAKIIETQLSTTKGTN